MKVTTYALIGSTLTQVLSFSAMYTAFGLGLGAAITFLVSPFLGGHIAARLHSDPAQLSMADGTAVMGSCVVGMVLGGLLSTLFFK
jgi:uncharacterized membrane protein